MCGANNKERTLDIELWTVLAVMQRFFSCRITRSASVTTGARGAAGACRDGCCCCLYCCCCCCCCTGAGEYCCCRAALGM